MTGAVLLAEGPAEFTAFSAKLLADAGFRVFSAGRTSIAGAEALGGADRPARSLFEDVRERGCRIDTLVLPVLWRPALTRTSVAAEIHAIVDHLRSAKDTAGSYPRYVVVVTPRRENILAAAGCASIKTLAGYLTRHLLSEDVRINVCSCPASPAGALRAAETVFTLCSGLLDEMRGQELVITDL